jgi:segregation and condensation protein B
MTDPTPSSTPGRQAGWPPPPGERAPNPVGPPPAAPGDQAWPPEPDVPAAPDAEVTPTGVAGAEVPAAQGPGPEGPGAQVPEAGVPSVAEPPLSGDQPADADAVRATDGRESPAGSGAAEGFEGGDPTAWPPDEAFDAVELDDRGWTRRDLEAILLVADEPVPAAVLAEIVGSRLSEVEELLVDLAGEYARDGRGFVLRAIAGGWRLYTNPGARTAVEAYLRAGQQSRLTRAALETLAVIAYRQPVTRFQVAAVRGVNVDGVFRTLASRGLIQEVGTDPGPGQATLYGTTPAFLEQLGLNDLDQLPPIKDYLPEGVDLLDLQDQP